MDPPFEVSYPRKVLSVVLRDGRVRHYADIHQLWSDCRDAGNLPTQDPGAQLMVREEDGSADFAAQFRRASKHPFWD
jgi:hypothetical protein